jgi:uncharacterized surface protein with fasciclin (FAS1) repeats
LVLSISSKKINFEKIDMKNLLKYSSIVFISLFIMSSCIDEDFEDSSTVGINDDPILLNVLNSESESNGDDLSILLQLLDENGLTGTLTSKRTQDQLTVFAPTNNAFEILAGQLGYNSLDDLLSDDDVDIVSILETHVAMANLSADQIANGSFRSISTLSGINIPISRDGGLVINANPDLEVIRSNAGGNGTVHIISRVIVPILFNINFSEDFGAEGTDCETALSTWTVENVVLEGGSGWGCTGFGFEGQGIQANGFDGGPQNVDSWIISPLQQSMDVVLNTLKFKYASRFDGPTPEIYVIAEEDYDESSFDASAWTQLEFNFPPPEADNGVFSDQAVRIPSEFNSVPYRFAFRYTSGSGATRVTIDNIELGEE